MQARFSKSPCLEEPISPEDMTSSPELRNPPQAQSPSSETNRCPLMRLALQKLTKKLSRHNLRLSGLDGEAHGGSGCGMALDEPQEEEPVSIAGSKQPTIGDPVVPAVEGLITLAPGVELRSLCHRTETKSGEKLGDVRRRPKLDPKRLHRQRCSLFNNDPRNSRTICALVEDMVATESQCAVRRDSPVPKKLPPATSLPIIEPDSDLDTPMMEMDTQKACLQADGTIEVGDDNENGGATTTALLTLRRASAPGGIKKHGLQYRTTEEVANNLANRIPNRLRMRRRDKVKAPRPKGTTPSRSDRVSTANSTTTLS